MRRHHILLCVVALIAVTPLFVYGCSCGHDFDFHVQSWLEAKRQLLHGTLRPHWAFSAAWGAGEPRFVFYPPLSWMLGEVLACFIPVKQLPAVYTLVVLLLAGQTMYLLAREFVAENAAMLGAAIYIVNPYMLFTAYERSAFAELLAAAWMPLLLRAVLRKQPSIPGIAVPVALLWLTNAPAAVVASYALAVLMAVRLAMAWRAGDRPGVARHLWVAVAGTVLGLALTAFYLLPAAYERRFVQIAMAVIVNMRVEDNFLFGHTGDVAHDAVLRTASWIAVSILGATAVLLTVRYRRSRDADVSMRHLGGILALLVVGITFLLTPLSRMLWQHVPELAFLQFPWRLLTVAVVAFGLAASLLAASLRGEFRVMACSALIIATALTMLGSHEFRQGCDAGDYPTAIAASVAEHGFPPTDEYTPLQADNDALKPGSAPYWHEPAKDGSRSAAITSFTFQDTQFKEHAISPSDALILNLRAYPNWEVSLTPDHGATVSNAPLAMKRREDGLLAFAVNTTDAFTVGVHWRRSLDEWIGIAVSSAAAGILAMLLWTGRSRRINT